MTSRAVRLIEWVPAERGGRCPEHLESPQHRLEKLQSPPRPRRAHQVVDSRECPPRADASVEMRSEALCGFAQMTPRLSCVACGVTPEIAPRQRSAATGARMRVAGQQGGSVEFVMGANLTKTWSVESLIA